MWVMIITNFMLVKHYIVVPVIKSTWFFTWLLDFMSICEYVDMLIIVLELALINTLLEKEPVKVLKRIQNIRLLQFEPLLHKGLQLDILLIM